MRHENITGSTLARGYVRTLRQQEELPLLRDHLLRLDPESRHDRFHGFMDDDFIERYAGVIAVPIRTHTNVTSVRNSGEGYEVERRLAAEQTDALPPDVARDAVRDEATDLRECHPLDRRRQLGLSARDARQAAPGAAAERARAQSLKNRVKP